MKKLLALMALLLVVSLLGGCAAGVSQEDYDKAKADLAAAQSERDAAKAELATLKAGVAKAAGYADLLALLGAVATASEEEQMALGMELMSKIQPLNDAELSAMFNEMAQKGQEMMAQGLSEEEMMTQMMDVYMQMFAHMADKIAELTK